MRLCVCVWVWVTVYIFFRLSPTCNTHAFKKPLHTRLQKSERERKIMSASTSVGVRKPAQEQSMLIESGRGSRYCKCRDQLIRAHNNSICFTVQRTLCHCSTQPCRRLVQALLEASACLHYSCTVVFLLAFSLHISFKAVDGHLTCSLGSMFYEKQPTLTFKIHNY